MKNDDRGGAGAFAPPEAPVELPDDAPPVRGPAMAIAFAFAALVGLQTAWTLHMMPILVELTRTNAVNPIALFGAIVGAVVLAAVAISLARGRRPRWSSMAALAVWLLATAAIRHLSDIFAPVFWSSTALSVVGIVLAWWRGRKQ